MAKAKVAVYGEGPTDYGKKVFGKEEWESGPIICLIYKCAEKAGVDIEIECVEKRFIDGKERVKLGVRQLRGLKGKAIPARYFKIYALQQGYRLGIFYCDTDKMMSGSNTNENVCRKEFERIYDEVEQGLDYEPCFWLGLPMVALKMIESWLLADEGAYIRCFGNMPVKPSLPIRPELIWGEKDNRNSNYPKNYMRRVLEQYHEISSRETFYRIAEEMDIDVLCEKCEISFGQFWKDFYASSNSFC
ncbi:hypothetical protein ABXS75_19465 [Roseburia hominis]